MSLFGEFLFSIGMIMGAILIIFICSKAIPNMAEKESEAFIIGLCVVTFLFGGFVISENKEIGTSGIESQYIKETYESYGSDVEPVDEECDCKTCRLFKVSYEVDEFGYVNRK